MAWLDPELDTADRWYLIGAVGPGIAVASKLTLQSPNAAAVSFPRVTLGEYRDQSFPLARPRLENAADQGNLSVHPQYPHGLLMGTGWKFRGELTMTDTVTGKSMRRTVEEGMAVQVPAGSYWLRLLGSSRSKEWSLRENPIILAAGASVRLQPQPPADFFQHQKERVRIMEALTWELAEPFKNRNAAVFPR